jgi:hypothetical protein
MAFFGRRFIPSSSRWPVVRGSAGQPSLAAPVGRLLVIEERGPGYPNEYHNGLGQRMFSSFKGLKFPGLRFIDLSFATTTRVESGRVTLG